MEMNFVINNLKIKRTDNTQMVADSNQLVRCNFTFDGEMWEQCERYAVFAYDDKSYVISLASGENANEYYCLLPDYCNTFPQFSVGIYGCYVDNETPVQFYTNIYNVRPSQSCKPIDISSDALPNQFSTIMTVIAQLQNEVRNISVDETMVQNLVETAVGNLYLSNVYALIGHNHDDRYAPKTHSHSEYLTEHQDISGKVDKEAGKGLSTNDFTDAYKDKVDANDAAKHTHGNKAVLDGISAEDVSAWNDKSDFSGSYNDLDDKPTIPSPITESDISNMGFTKNAGTYIKPNDGIPLNDLANDVQVSLGKADSALQDHQDISGKANKVANATNGNLAGLDNNGDLTDSGVKSSDFAGATHNHDAIYAPINHSHNGFVTATRLTNVFVAVADWISDNTFIDYPYRAAITAAGATASDYANVFFAPSQVNEGIYSPLTTTGADTVYIYAIDVPSAAITIPMIEVVKT